MCASSPLGPQNSLCSGPFICTLMVLIEHMHIKKRYRKMKVLHLLHVYGFSKYSVREKGNCLELTPVQVFLFVFCFLFLGGEGDLCNYYCVFYFIPRSISFLCLLMLEVDCRVTVTSHNIHDKPTEQAGMLGN